ncbi:hypothetical protein TEU_04030 [Thermococcus eurythermalis]|uniref:Uncharacterized protein n=1 Tax=Thermococcus eurythermalis TaxID=1505907 RepID=A0A097QSY4_9EURY|nr:hypothetical protein [Thermococcus eurythermalis]AIU69574.1 hypothetical protein TEU_04030 [Thermococcus eurythermalis]
MVSRSRLRHKGQTAVELLFVVAILITGIVYLVSSAVDVNNGVSVVYAFRTAGSDVCTYLNTGVVVNDSTHAPLNNIVELWNYTPVECRFVDLTVVQVNDTLDVSMVYSYPDSATKPAFIGNVTDFLRLKLSSVPGFRLAGNKLYYGEMGINLTVVVR